MCPEHLGHRITETDGSTFRRMAPIASPSFISCVNRSIRFDEFVWSPSHQVCIGSEPSDSIAEVLEHLVVGDLLPILPSPLKRRIGPSPDVFDAGERRRVRNLGSIPGLSHL